MSTKNSEQVGTKEEVDFLRQFCCTAQESHETNEWEKDFCHSLEDKLNRFGTKAFLSQKQREMIDTITDKL